MFHEKQSSRGSDKVVIRFNSEKQRNESIESELEESDIKGETRYKSMYTKNNVKISFSKRS